MKSVNFGPRARLAGTALALAVLGPACGTRGLSFVQDRRVSMSAPAERRDAVLPLRVAWAAKGYDGLFGVFFDAVPMRPGANLRSIVPDDDPCRLDPGCPDSAWLAQRLVFVTRANQLVVDALPDRRRNNRSRDRHQVTIILLDEHGDRVGETAFVREFIVTRND